MTAYDSAAISVLCLLCALIVLFALIQNDVVSFKNDNAEIAVNGLLQILGTQHVLYYNRLSHVQHLDRNSEELKANYATARM